MYDANDGGDVQVDPVHAGPGLVFRYSISASSSQLYRHTFSSALPWVEKGPAVDVTPAAGLPNFTPQFDPQYELNSVTAGRLVMAGDGTGSTLYELLNADLAGSGGIAPQWFPVILPLGFQLAGGLAYGGRIGAVTYPDLLVVGAKNGVYLRTTFDTPLVPSQTAFPGGSVQDLALDPNNWQHFFVTDGTGVWETADAGITWKDLSGNLTAGNEPVTTNIRSIEFVPPGTGTVVASGNWGISRLVLGGANPVWTRYGAGLPNALAREVRYNATDDVLVVATQGRGAWMVPDVSATIQTPGVLEVDGNVNSPDHIKLERDPDNPLMLDVF
jgi:hypothetical protein